MTPCVYKPKKVAAIHDLSGVGRCSLTVILPVLSALGIQVCPMPTALLSSHTGGYDGYSFTDTTSDMNCFASHWKQLHESFDAVYSGFLGSDEQVCGVLDYAAYCKKEFGSLFLADPVMGDDGMLYTTYTKEMCKRTRDIVSAADIITPNLTEATNLLGIDYREDFSDSEYRDMVVALSDMGPENVVLTGITSHTENEIGIYCFDRSMKSPKDAIFTHTTPHLSPNYPGTGDVFASVLLGKRLRGRNFFDSAVGAAEFVCTAVDYTRKLDTLPREGLAVEALWDKLTV